MAPLSLNLYRAKAYAALEPHTITSAVAENVTINEFQK